MFIKRLLDHLLNQILVEGLANSKTFQRFAVWSHSAYKEVSSKSKEVKVDEHINKISGASKSFVQKMREDFQKELQKIQNETKK